MPLQAAPLVGAVGAFIARFLPAFSRMFGMNIGPYVAMLLVFFGLNIMVTGVSLLPFISDARAAWTGLPADLADWLGVLRVDMYVSAILSAHAIKAGKEAGRTALVMAGRR